MREATYDITGRNGGVVTLASEPIAGLGSQV